MTPARSGNVRIAYQVVGSGPFDLVFVPGYVSNMGRSCLVCLLFTPCLIFSTDPV